MANRENTGADTRVGHILRNFGNDLQYCVALSDADIMKLPNIGRKTLLHFRALHGYPKPNMTLDALQTDEGVRLRFTLVGGKELLLDISPDEARDIITKIRGAINANGGRHRADMMKKRFETALEAARRGDA